MSEKKDIKASISKFLLIVLVGAIASYLIAIIITVILSGNAFDLNSIMAAVGDSRTRTWFLVFAGGGFIFLMMSFTGVKKDDSFKGQADLENVRWLTDKELDKAFPNCYFHELKNFSHEGVPFKAVYNKGKIKVHFAPNYHIIIVGTTGAGKGVSFVEPTLQIMSELKNKPSLFITDPKGELYNRHSLKIKNSGYDIKVLDMIEPYNSLKWNPLENIFLNYQRALNLEQEIFKHTNDDVNKYDFIKVGEINNAEWYEFDNKAFSNLRDTLVEVEVSRTKIRDDCFDDINDIAGALCPITDPKSASWDQGARDYVVAILVAMLEDSANPELGMTVEKYNFYNLYKLAMNKENDMEYMRDYFSGRSQLSKTIQLSSHIIYSNAKQTRDSYMSTLAQKLSMFADNGICYLTSKNEIDFTQFDERPTAFFVKIPDERETRYNLATICIAQSYKEFVRKARSNEYISNDAKKSRDASLKRPLFYIMDEFANMPPINKIDKMITVARARRIYFNMIIQSYAQLDNVYGKEKASIIQGNSNAKIYVGTPDQETREAFSKELGNYQIKVGSKSESKNQDGKTTPGSSTQLQARPLMYPSDLDKLQRGNLIIKIFPHNPINSTITPYYEAKDVYKLGKLEMPYIPGKKLDEEKIFYDIKIRNKKVLK